MRVLVLLVPLMVCACDGGGGGDDTSDGAGDSAVADPTDSADSDTADADTADSDTADPDTADPDTGSDTGLPPDPNAAVIGTWSTSLNTEACGFGFQDGAVAEAYPGSSTGFTLTLNESFGGQQAVFGCTATASGPFTCNNASYQGGDLTTCAFMTSITEIGGTIADGGGNVSMRVAQNVAGPECPPVPSCDATATAVVTITP